jgi:hypothetical protein
MIRPILSSAARFSDSASPRCLAAEGVTLGQHQLGVMDQGAPTASALSGRVSVMAPAGAADGERGLQPGSSPGIGARLWNLMLRVARLIIWVLSFQWLGGLLCEQGEDLGPFADLEALDGPMRPNRHSWQRIPVYRQRGGRLERLEVEAIDNQGRGNCFFHSLAISLQELLERQPQKAAPIANGLRRLIARAQRQQAQHALAAQNAVQGRGRDGSQARAEFLGQVVAALRISPESILAGRELAHREMRGWAALLVLFSPAEELALLATVLDMAPRSEGTLSGGERLRAARAIFRPRVQGSDSIRHLLCGSLRGSLDGQIGLISVREEQEQDSSAYGAEPAQGRQCLVVDDDGRGQDLAQVFIVHMGRHFFSARLPR